MQCVKGVGLLSVFECTFQLHQDLLNSLMMLGNEALIGCRVGQLKLREHKPFVVLELANLFPEGLDVLFRSPRLFAPFHDRRMVERW